MKGIISRGKYTFPRLDYLMREHFWVSHLVSIHLIFISLCITSTIIADHNLYLVSQWTALRHLLYSSLLPNNRNRNSILVVFTNGTPCPASKNGPRWKEWNEETSACKKWRPSMNWELSHWTVIFDKSSLLDQTAVDFSISVWAGFNLKIPPSPRPLASCSISPSLCLRSSTSLAKFSSLCLSS